MRITVDRDSVAAGDDTDRHDHRYWIWIDRVTDDVLELSIAWFWLPARPAEPVLHYAPLCATHRRAGGGALRGRSADVSLARPRR